VTCSELRDAMYDYVAEELGLERRDTFEFHLKSCDHCTFYLESYRHTVTLTRKMGCGPLPPGLEERLRAALKDYLQSEGRADAGGAAVETAKGGEEPRH